MTERLYYADSALLQFAATVTDIREASRTDGASLWEIALDRSAFYPASGGQPFDTGTLTARSPRGTEVTVEIESVREDGDGEVWHATRKPLLAGTVVAASVDARRRRDHMQQHSGQHLLSACFLQVANWPTVSFHLGPELSTIDLATGDVGDERVAEVCGQAAALANERIFQALPVSLRNVSAEQARVMLADGRLRKLPEREGSFRVVEIAGVEHNACGGTHVGNTAQIGALLLRGTERVRDTRRVSFVCGNRALAEARKDFAAIAVAGRVLSVGRDGLPAAAVAALEQAKSASKQLEKLLADMAAWEGQQFARSAAGNGIPAREFPERGTAYLKTAAANAAESTPRGSFLCWARADDRVFFAVGCGGASGRSANDMVRAMTVAHGGKGGGSATLAQGSIPAEALAGFLQDVSSM